MSTFARSLAALLALAIIACAFLPWVGASPAGEIALRSLIATNETSLAHFGLSLAVPVLVAAGLVIVGAVVNSRTLIIIGGLLAVAVPSAWILLNALTRSTTAVSISQIQFGAYGVVVAGFLLLILCAVAVDIRTPSAR